MKGVTTVATLLLAGRDPYVCVPSRPMAPAIIVFPGTMNARDLLLDDLDIRTTRWPRHLAVGDGRVHSGFARRTTVLMARMRDFIDRHDRFVLAGHSLGGAVAVLTASQLRGSKVVEAVYTFGMPRMCRESFRSVYERQGLHRVTTHYATERDPIVFRVPRVFEELGTYTILKCDASGEWAHHDMQTYYDLVV